MSSLKNAVIDWPYSEYWDRAGGFYQELCSQWRDPHRHTELTSGQYPRSLELVTGDFGKDSPLLEQSYHKILALEYYDKAYRRLQMAKDLKRPVLVTGQPGTGKSYLLWYFLIRLLADNKDVFFVFKGGVQIYFRGPVAYQPKPFTLSPILALSTKPSNPLLCLLDWDEPIQALSTMFTNQGVFFVQASSPNPTRYEWAKQRVLCRWAQPLWTRQELIEGLKIQFLFDEFERGLITLLHNPKAEIDMKVKYAARLAYAAVLPKLKPEPQQGAARHYGSHSGESC